MWIVFMVLSKVIVYRQLESKCRLYALYSAAPLCPHIDKCTVALNLWTLTADRPESFDPSQA